MLLPLHIFTKCSMGNVACRRAKLTWLEEDSEL